MPSIAQAQSMFLNSGGLDNLGLSKSVTYYAKVNKQNKAVSFTGDFVGLGIMESMLALYIGEFLSRAADNLNASNSISTGELEKSLAFEVVPLSRGYKINFLANDYYKFVDQGVQGAGSSEKNSTSPFRFKYITPSKSHVEAIKRWIKTNNLTALVSDINKYGSTNRERKGLSMPEDRAAYVIARSIKRKGLRRTGFWQNAFDETFKDFGQKMSEALGQSITVNLEQMAKEIKSRKGTKIPGI